MEGKSKQKNEYWQMLHNTSTVCPFVCLFVSSSRVNGRRIKGTLSFVFFFFSGQEFKNENVQQHELFKKIINCGFLCSPQQTHRS